MTPQQRALVVVVEDDPSTRDILVAAIEEEPDLRVVGLETGEELLAMIRVESIDLVLLDIGLPGMRGDEVIRLLKADPTTAGVPVVALTVLGPRIEEAARAAGGDAVLAKPFDLDALLAMVRRFV